MSMIQASQYAGERKTYTYDWTAELDGDTIVSDTWSVVPSTYTVTENAVYGYVTSALLCVISTPATVTCEVTCTSGAIRKIKWRVNYLG